MNFQFYFHSISQKPNAEIVKETTSHFGIFETDFSSAFLFYTRFVNVIVPKNKKQSQFCKLKNNQFGKILTLEVKFLNL